MGLGFLAAVATLKAQAQIARKVIGKPLGEEALAADRVYKKKYGDPLDLLLLGDSIAAGLGAAALSTVGALVGRGQRGRTR